MRLVNPLLGALETAAPGAAAARSSWRGHTGRRCGPTRRTWASRGWPRERYAPFIAILATACADERRPLDAAMMDAIRGGDVPGLAVAQVRGGQITFAARGLADVAGGIPVTPDTAFLFFSVTKLFTATAVMQLVERGEVGLDEPVARWVPFPAPADGAPTAHITVRHLLSHSSGLANPLPISWVHLESERAPDLREITERLLRKHPTLEFEPGTRYRYSNLGYLVLGVLVERVTGQRFQDYVARNILEPLRMRSTSFDLPATGLATGYYRRYSIVAQAMKLVVDARLYGPSIGRWGSFRRFLVDGPPYGGLVGSCSDLARFAAALAGDGSFEGGRILSPGSAAEMRRPQRDRNGARLLVGLGWHFGSTDGAADVRSLGGGGGYKAEVRALLGTDRAAVVCANETMFDTGDLAAAALR